LKKKLTALTLILCLVFTYVMPTTVMAETTGATQTASADEYVYQPGVNMNYSKKPVIDYLTSFWNKTPIRDWEDEKVFNTAVKYDDTNHPSGGVTVLVFFCTRCGVDRADFDKLNATGWLDDPRVNVVAYEAGGPSLPRVDLNFFKNNYISEDTASKIEFHPNGWYVFQAYLSMLYNSKVFVDQSFYNYPLVLVITEEEVVIETGLENKEYVEGTTDMAYVVRYAEIGKPLSGVIDNTLKHHFGGVSDTQQEVSVSAGETWDVSVGGQQDYNAVDEVVKLTNQARKAKNDTLSTLVLDDELTKAAMQRAAELSLNFDHKRPDGSEFYTALEGVYSGRIDNGTTENIACASLDAEEAVQGWIESRDHYANMIDPKHTRMGVGHFEADGITYWVQLFDDDSLAARSTAKEDASVDHDTFKKNIKSDCFNVKTKTQYLDVNALKTTTVHLGESKTISTVSNNTTLAKYENLQANGPVRLKAASYTDAKDAGGKIIAKASMDDKGNLVLTGQTEGSGTMELKFSENQKTAIKISVTVSKKAAVDQGQGNHTCKWSNWKTWFPGNCYDVVKERRYCLCGKKEYRDTNRYNHSALLDYKREEPTCITTGRTAGTKCYDCKKVIAGLEEIPVLPHDMQVLREGEEPTCSSWGLTPELKCSGCYYTEKAKAIPKLPHKEEEVIKGKAATCKTTGLTDGKKCKECGTVTVKQKQIPATGEHTSYVAIKGTAATCKKEGKTDLLKCSDCGTTIQPQITIPKLTEHAYEQVVIRKASLSIGGEIVTRCKDCKTVKSTTTIRMPKTFTLSKTTYDYSGNVCTPAVTVKDSAGAVLKEGIDYTVSYASGRVNPGTYNVTVTMTGNYSGSKTLSFEIKSNGGTGGTVTPTPDTTDPAPTVVKIKTVKLSKTSVVYTGKAQKPKVTVKDTNGKILKASNYTVTYKNNKAIGKATVTVKGKGNYSGTKIATFKIVPKAPIIKKPVAAKKAITVKWAKGKKAQVTGYEVLTATNKKFTKGKKTTKVKKYSQASVKVKKLKAKKTYYVKVRTYKTVKGVKYYSAWSKVKTVKTK